MLLLIPIIPRMMFGSCEVGRENGRLAFVEFYCVSDWYKSEQYTSLQCPVPNSCELRLWSCFHDLLLLTLKHIGELSIMNWKMPDLALLSHDGKFENKTSGAIISKNRSIGVTIQWPKIKGLSCNLPNYLYQPPGTTHAASTDPSWKARPDPVNNSPDWSCSLPHRSPSSSRSLISDSRGRISASFSAEEETVEESTSIRHSCCRLHE